MFDYDVIVVGGGHAGLEAAFAAAHMKQKTLLISLNFKKIGNMPCNPSIGGSAKGIVVREIDALGGMMGKAADKNYLQMKMLNTSKGPGVQCLRAQEDKLGYPEIMQDFVKETPNLTFLESMVTSLLFDEKCCYGVVAEDNKEITSKAVILATGTYMESDILIGHERTRSGPDGERPSLGLSPFLRDKMGLKIYRLKTGTPPRLARDSIDFTKTSREDGTNAKLAFSYETNKYIPFEEQYPCYLTYTNLKTHEIIRSNLDKSAMYGGIIHSVGPRYCPSIETKVVNFASRERHQLFLEPESRETDSIYIQGLSTSMPRDVQVDMVHSIVGLENAKFLKYAYAIEYDAIETTEYDASLMIKKYPGLFISGQICGTSGYEEAGALGLIAGINASLRNQNKDPLILKRYESYIGVMIDDLVTKGTVEPYRLMSSRAEFRLLLRHDNADMRLTEIGHNIGLITDERYKKFTAKKERIAKSIEILNDWRVRKEDVKYLEKFSVIGGLSFADVLRRPQVTLKDLLPISPKLLELNLTDEEIEEIEISIKYDGYIKNEKREAEHMSKLDDISLPTDIDYMEVDNLALEARQKLNLFKPQTIGQASRISGVNPSDVAILLMIFKRR